MRPLLAAVLLCTACNQAPTSPTIAIEPAEPHVSDLLKMVIVTESVDQNSKDIVSYDIRWMRDGTEVEELRGVNEVAAVKTARGQEWTVEVTPTDGVLAGVAASAAVTIINTQPVVSDVSISPTQVLTNGTLEVAYSTADADDDLVEATIRWEVNGTDIDITRTKINGLDYFDRDDEVQAFVTGNDGDIDSEEVASNVVTVQNSAPTPPEASLSTLQPVEGKDQLVCNIDADGTDLDGDTLSYVITWEKNGSAYTGSTSTTTWDGDTIASSRLVKDDTWMCTATATDGSVQSSGYVTEIATVKSAGPTVGDTGTFGVVSGDGWKVCRADGDSGWIAANSNGTYKLHDICAHLGYTEATAWGGTCGTVCGYCGTDGDENYDGGGLSGDQLGITVHWLCE